MSDTLQISIGPKITPNDFFSRLRELGVSRGAVIHPSISAGQPLGEHLTAFDELIRGSAGYSDHEAVFFMADAETNCLYFVFVHNTSRGMAQGGTRFLGYPTMGDMLFDGLRLSRAMTEKNSVAQIWWGGGKAIICPIDGHKNVDSDRRKRIFENYGKFVASLNGVYVAAEDMNTTPEDMQTILSQNRFVTCLPKSAGGSSNPSPWTAGGVFQAMLASVKFAEPDVPFKDKTVLVQGVGNVGSTIARLAYAAGATVLVADPYQPAVDQILKELPGTKAVATDAIFDVDCDIFAPSARGGVIGPDEVDKLRCKYVIGAANNQLVDDVAQSEALAARGIWYLPDFFINRMGIVNCANEQYGYLEDDLEAAVKKIYDDVLWLLEEARKEGKTPYEIAILQARKLTAESHPIMGHRGLRIIKDLLDRY
jgi:glutamate dehydrogenase/leucine dehydrogenase